MTCLFYAFEAFYIFDSYVEGAGRKKLEVTSISGSPVDVRQLAVGYSDGSIRLWDVGTR